MKSICVFDVNETLLNLNVLDAKFKQFFNDASVKNKWFNQLIESSFVSIITNSYTPFGKIGEAALDMIAEMKGITLSQEDKMEILGKVKMLPAYPEVANSLKTLKEAGFTIVSLTNSTLQVVTAQLENAEIAKYFDFMFSADTVKRLKPAPEPYYLVANHFQTKTENLRLIAAHAWDIAGAVSAGCKTAFVEREGKVLNPLVVTPDIVGKDIREVVNQIIQKEAKN